MMPTWQMFPCALRAMFNKEFDLKTATLRVALLLPKSPPDFFNYTHWSDMAGMECQPIGWPGDPRKRKSRNAVPYTSRRVIQRLDEDQEYVTLFIGDIGWKSMIEVKYAVIIRDGNNDGKLDPLDLPVAFVDVCPNMTALKGEGLRFEEGPRGTLQLSRVIDAAARMT